MRRLLWIDCTAGALVGILVLALSPWLSRLYALPLGLVLGIGAANLAYGAFSFSVARRRVRPRALLVTLIAANAAWGLFCAVALVVLRDRASAFGLASLAAEGLFVGGLAALEWRHRELLLEAQ